MSLESIGPLFFRAPGAGSEANPQGVGANVLNYTREAPQRGQAFQNRVDCRIGAASVRRPRIRLRGVRNCSTVALCP